MTRRELMKGLFAGATMPLWMRMCSAQASGTITSGYKAIVCLSLVGGNDANNLVVPTDSAAYSSYASIRGGLALPKGTLLPIQSATTNTFGLHPALANMAKRFNSQQASIVANVGLLKQPTTKATVGNLDAKMLSHPDSQAAWESGITTTGANLGWGGQIADLVVSQSGNLPPVISVSGDSVFTAGRNTEAVCFAAAATQLTSIPASLIDEVTAIAQDQKSSDRQLVAVSAAIRAAAFHEQQVLQNAVASGNLQTVFPTSRLGASLNAIAKIIAGRSTIGASRQLFYGTQGSYDTHGIQLQEQQSLYSDLDASVGAFMNAMDEIGLSDNVLICTVSDFGRTYQANTDGGSDHGWGSHQLILGGGLSGGKIIGTIPDPELGGTLDAGKDGIWIPSLSNVQMTSAIARWFGVSDSQIGTIFPDLQNFSIGPISL